MDKFKKMLNDMLILAQELEGDEDVPYSLQCEVKFLIATIEDVDVRMCRDSD